jgi:hypothetical protein
MEHNDWVLNAYCRSCGVSNVAHVGSDHRIEWPYVIHEANCELAGRDDVRESAGAPL